MSERERPIWADPGEASRSVLIFVGGTAMAVAIGLAAFLLLMRPSGNEVLAMTVFLSVTAVASVAAGYSAHRLRWLGRAPRLVWALLGGYLLASALILLNVLVTARLMFISAHDLLLSTVLLLFATVIAVSLGYLLSSTVAAAVGRLSTAATEVADGHLGVAVPVEGPKELADLASTFNRMTQQLREAEARRAALEAERRDLIVAVGHDLRTPLASIRLVTDALADELVDDPETAARYLQTAQRDLDVLSALVDDLFLLTQLDAGGVELDVQENSLSDVVSDTLEAFAVRAENRRVRLEGSSRAEPDVAEFDVRYVERALANLVDNALRHAPDGGRVEITTRTVPGGAQVRVADDGPGIDPADLPHVFDRFYRGETSRNRTTGGGGLGLAIVKSIAQAHGGSVEVSSVAGRGSTFTLTLPVAGAA